jgi:hypothetical protein
MDKQDTHKWKAGYDPLTQVFALETDTFKFIANDVTPTMTVSGVSLDPYSAFIDLIDYYTRDSPPDEAHWVPWTGVVIRKDSHG